MAFKRTYYVLLLAALAFRLSGQTKEICVLDLTKKNAETTKGNLFSLEHLLKSGGFSYHLTDSVNLALSYKIILTTSNLEATTFNTSERDSIKSFVKRGGILIATNNKDTTLNSCFGITSTSFNYTRFFLNFKTSSDPVIFKLFDEPEEKQIRFADTTEYTTTFGSRAFSPSTADTLAVYETGEVAATHNAFFFGHTYMLGTQYKEIILRPQVKQDYSASRAYSNNFEPGQDVFVFFISGILKKHLQHVVNKHSIPCNFKAALVLTHDVDATSSMDLFDNYASYEKLNNIRSTYLITTHYMHDELARNFFDGYEPIISNVHAMGHDIQSHSVSHVPDFDNSSIVQMGAPGNNRNIYQPYYNGSVSSNVTIFGEAEVSRDLLQNIVPQKITFFRPGYLAFHKHLIRVLDSLGYPFSSSHSANDVMTNFPFFSHTDLSMNGRLTKVLEISNSISDVFMVDPISETNFRDKVEIWKNVFRKCYNNYTSSVLLIHPTRYYKLFAQQLFTSWLPQDAFITTLSDYGNYWLNRDSISFTTLLNVDTLSIYLSAPKNAINENLSFIVNNGKDLSKINVYSSDNISLTYAISPWENNSVILHKNCERPSYTNYAISEQPEVKNVYIHPNPSFNNTSFLHFELMEERLIKAEIYDVRGAFLGDLIPEQDFILGSYDIPLPEAFSDATYIVRLNIAGTIYKLKWIQTHTN